MKGITMKFDLYLASYDDNKIISDAWKNDWPLLYSQINNRGVLMKRFDAPTNGKLLVDSGAHSAHTKGIQLDLEEYINFSNEHILSYFYHQNQPRNNFITEKLPK